MKKITIMAIYKRLPTVALNKWLHALGLNTARHKGDEEWVTPETLKRLTQAQKECGLCFTVKGDAHHSEIVDTKTAVLLATIASNFLNV